MGDQIGMIGVGAALVDLLAHVDEEFVASVAGAKGGMELIGEEERAALAARLPENTVLQPGGSAANTIHGLAMLGARTGFLGKLGEDQAAARYRESFSTSKIDVSHMKSASGVSTGMCIVLVTPDSERTCRTCLGASATLTPQEISPADFAGYGLAHIEGYMLFNRELAVHILQCAKSAGCQVSLDLGSFEVVKQNRELLDELLEKYVDLVFANEDEAAAFCRSADPEKALAQLAVLCEVAAVKLGEKGAWLARDDERIFVPAEKVAAVDTTGAGDLWAAGFLYGWSRGAALADCGRLGALLGATVVTETGARIPDATWLPIRQQANSWVNNEKK